jgi:hypothetical protein
MRTAIIIGAGLIIGALFLFAERLLGRGPETLAIGAKLFIALWFVAAAANMWLGVAKAGYSFMEELPIFLVIFGVPAAAAGVGWWKYA